MSNLVIKDLPTNKQLDSQALVEFSGGINPSSLLAQIRTDAAKAVSGYTLDQEPELGVTPKLGALAALANPPFTPNS